MFPSGLARKATYLIIVSTRRSRSVNDVQKAIGEITNMIGGNINALSTALSTVLQVACSRV